jgi:hypothetical protein
MVSQVAGAMVRSYGPELWSGAMVLRLAVWAGIQGMTPET